MKTHMILNCLLAVLVILLLVIFLKSRNTEKLDTNQAVDVTLTWTTYTVIDSVIIVSRDTMTFYTEKAEKVIEYALKLK